MDTLDILDCYRSSLSRQQTLYRIDRLTEARSKNKSNFHINATLTVINIAKVKHWLIKINEVSKPSSMNDIKTMNHNRLSLEQFIDVFSENAYFTKFDIILSYISVMVLLPVNYLTKY